MLDGLRNHYEPLTLVRCHRRHHRLRHLWSCYGPLCLIVFGLAMILGSWVALLMRETGFYGG